jgi:hypothetical protein
VEKSLFSFNLQNPSQSSRYSLLIYLHLERLTFKKCFLHKFIGIDKCSFEERNNNKCLFTLYRNLQKQNAVLRGQAVAVKEEVPKESFSLLHSTKKVIPTPFTNLYSFIHSFSSEKRVQKKVNGAYQSLEISR